MSADHDAQPPPLTVVRRLVRGEVLRRGTAGAYHAVAEDAGEPHAVRDDLLPGAAAVWGSRPVRPLLALAHVTDLQLADVQSPVRCEFLNAEHADPRFAELVPVQRPQEALTPHAVLATVATLNRVTAAPVGGGPLALVVTTGDAVDNAQWNELHAVLALLDSGTVRPRSGGDRYEGVQSTSWPGEVFWRPDGDGPGGRPDLFRAQLGFPLAPGLLDRALDAFPSPGLALPWLACYGNHEALVQGVGAITPEVAAALVGDRKPLAMPAGLDRDRAAQQFASACQAFLAGPGRRVTPDPGRRPMTRREFVAAHLAAAPQTPDAPTAPEPGRPGVPGPAGHGFTVANLQLDTAYYVHDVPGVRFIGLDTTRAEGGAAGALDTDQLWWLHARLAEVHSRYRAADGTTMTTSAPDRLVVVLSHHGADTMADPRRSPADDLVGGDELLRLLHRFPNVVLWLNGHTHTNRVRARVDPGNPARGFWEVTTCAVVDWPGQSRLVELLDAGDGVLAVACTMVDHDSPLGPGRSLEGSALTTRQLAALHRELAANQPGAGAGSALEGTPGDRNVVLPLRAPFDLSTLPLP